MHCLAGVQFGADLLVSCALSRQVANLGAVATGKAAMGVHQPWENLNPLPPMSCLASPTLGGMAFERWGAD